LFLSGLGENPAKHVFRFGKLLSRKRDGFLKLIFISSPGLVFRCYGELEVDTLTRLVLAISFVTHYESEADVMQRLAGGINAAPIAADAFTAFPITGKTNLWFGLNRMPPTPRYEPALYEQYFLYVLANLAYRFSVALIVGSSVCF
jgi:hypothetical protein